MLHIVAVKTHGLCVVGVAIHFRYRVQQTVTKISIQGKRRGMGEARILVTQFFGGLHLEFCAPHQGDSPSKGWWLLLRGNIGIRASSSSK